MTIAGAGPGRLSTWAGFFVSYLDFLKTLALGSGMWYNTVIGNIFMASIRMEIFTEGQWCQFVRTDAQLTVQNDESSYRSAKCFDSQSGQCGRIPHHTPR